MESQSRPEADGREVATGIVEREKDDPHLAHAVLDPSIFQNDGRPSIAERNRKLIDANLAPFRPTHNTRVSATGQGPPAAS